MSLEDTEQKVLNATRRHLQARGGDWDSQIGLDDAICQDLMIFGVDIEDYVGELEEDFGKVVWTIPWLHFSDQTSSFRGGGCLFFPPWLVWRLVRRLFVPGPIIPRADPRNHPYRLTLREIAKIIDEGGWPQDRQL
jgi:hypothetical protein